MTHPGGRPLLFTSPEDLQAKIDAYFKECDSTLLPDGKTTRPYTITGLAVALETTRRTLLDYEEKDEFSHTVKKAKAKIEQSYEERALTGQASAPVSIFTLKNNFEWRDNLGVDHTSNGKPIPLLNGILNNDSDKKGISNDKAD